MSELLSIGSVKLSFHRDGHGLWKTYFTGQAHY